MDVELDAFSGRPNPKWDLSSEQSADFLAAIATLPETKATLNFPGLGYRGFILRTGNSLIRVYGRLVQVQQPGTVLTYSDTANLEMQLAQQARDHGFGFVVQDIRSRL